MSQTRSDRPPTPILDRSRDANNEIPLQQIRPGATCPSVRNDVSTPSSTSHAPEQEQEEEPEPPLPTLLRLWRQHVSIEVDFSACRDHLAVERTFLGYLRTSMMLANLGVIIAQLFALEQSDSGFGYSQVAQPFATTCFSCAVVTIFLGAVRTWRHQHALLQDKALTGGFELTTVGFGLLANFKQLVVVFFAFLVAISVVKEETVE
ncbi:uncharacterized protein MKZ38_007861 [Zalerion maritima]|uniref:DUF202 domain-containing protein n=1 Tax=Zalerion maritima TaxID=339359 RepID=A0AAD5RWN5_9PEZI|nr:uncharacterized protein MKZ38_007861 [Zalerion maritima]